MKPQTKSWICWTLPLASLRSRALVARCEHEHDHEHEHEQDVLPPELILLVQVCMTKALDGVVVKVPEGVNDQR